MTQMKLGGLVLTGVGAYLVLNKVLNMIRGSVHDITEASRWKAYYQCKRDDPLAPGYERRASTVAEDGGDPPEKAENNASMEKLKGTINDAVKKAVDELFKKPEGAKIAEKEPLNAKYRYDIYQISKDDFTNSNTYRDKQTFDYFMNDDVLIRSYTGEPVCQCDYLPGINLAIRFQARRDQNEDNWDVMYFRNDAYATDYEVICRSCAYSDMMSAEITDDGQDEDEPKPVLRERKPGVDFAAYATSDIVAE